MQISKWSTGRFYLWFPTRKKRKTCILKITLKFQKVNLHFCFNWNICTLLPIRNGLLRPKRTLCSFMKEKCFLLQKSTPPSCSFQSKYIVMYFARGKMTSRGEKATLPAKETTLTVKRPELIKAWSSGCKMRHMKTITKVTWNRSGNMK